MAQDLRSFIAAPEEQKDLARIGKEVDPRGRTAVHKMLSTPADRPA